MKVGVLLIDGKQVVCGACRPPSWNLNLDEYDIKEGTQCIYCGSKWVENNDCRSLVDAPFGWSLKKYPLPSEKLPVQATQNRWSMLRG